MTTTTTHHLPADDAMRRVLHDEVHARPPARIRLPALVIYVAVFNSDVRREDELAHLQKLSGQASLNIDQLSDNFLRLRLDGCTLKWERHTEFTRYSIVQPLPEGAGLGVCDPELPVHESISPAWIAGIPGRTFSAIKIAMVEGDLSDPVARLDDARTWLGEHPVVASLMGNQRHSIIVTDFQLRETGYERMLIIAPPGTSETRAGRISARLIELETYRLMALKGLPVSKLLGPQLGMAERQLVDITSQLENKSTSDQALLDTLVSLAAGVERLTAEHAYRFSATRAYHDLVEQRVAELREQPIPGTQTISEFMHRRLSPAMATVAATSHRLTSLSERISRASALLRTRVDIATEEQNRQLLEKLTRGQELQLNLQTTVEGLSIAAISYYVVSLVYYFAKAGKLAGLPLSPEIVAGVSIPVVLFGVWRLTKRIHDKLHSGGH
ncbi:DUF3422 domain-containing protein [Hydrogenophaga sp. 5NK40-0174]|uniref:DUF3422 family protein n=1 Tax=Hydrogenophaga sp. 5NK40-0174 TaxID=3127649 RepID=UPI00333EBA10